MIKITYLIIGLMVGVILGVLLTSLFVISKDNKQACKIIKIKEYKEND